MPAYTSMSMYVYTFILFVAVIGSCTNNNIPKIDDIVWKNADSSKGISYYISDKNAASKNGELLSYIGYIENGKFVRDTAFENQLLFNVIINQQIKNNEAIKALPKGASGFIKVDTHNFFLQAFEKMNHFTVYFPAEKRENLKKDSLKLAALNKFEKIEISSSEKALAEFEIQNADTTWKQFINDNPLPESITLTIKKSLLSQNNYDSTKNLLMQLFPGSEINAAFDAGIYGTDSNLKKIIIYKFTVF